MTAEEVQELVRQGWPLSRIEEYADWLDAVKQEAAAAFRAFAVVPLETATQKPH